MLSAFSISSIPVTSNAKDTFRFGIPALPEQLSFAGETVPLEKPFIKEYFERNFTLIYYQTGTMLNLLKLSNRWFPFIEERLKYHNIPRILNIYVLLKVTCKILFQKRAQ